MYFLIDNRFLVYYDKKYWDERFPGYLPQNYLNADMYTLGNRGMEFLHNETGPAVIDLKTGNELYFIKGQKTHERGVPQIFKNKFEDMINDVENEEREIEFTTIEAYNGIARWRMYLKRK